MRRHLVRLFCGLYIAALAVGTACHTVNFGMYCHPVMYFLVWDMYCGWNAYDSQLRLVGEGVSGRYSELDPAPWGPFRPYGTFDRLQRIGTPGNIAKSALHIAQHTEHEPLARILYIEEAWAKKYDLPDHVYEARYGRPKDQHRYTTLRMEIAPDGTIVRNEPSWLDQQQQRMLADNPRLEQDVWNSRPFWMVDGQRRGGNDYFRSGPEQSSITTQVYRGPAAN